MAEQTKEKSVFSLGKKTKPDEQKQKQNKSKKQKKQMADNYYDPGVSDVLDVVTTTFGRTRRITVEGREELKRKFDAMADECVARNKKGVACEEERKRCKQHVSPRRNGATFHARLDNFLYSASERAEKSDAKKEGRDGKKEASEARDDRH